MAIVRVGERTLTLVRTAAQLFGVPEAHIIDRLVREMLKPDDVDAPPADPWEPVAVYGVYQRAVVKGLYLPQTRRLQVTSGPLAEQAFNSPSAAARAVVRCANPNRSEPVTNGWKFWRLLSTDERLDVLREEAHDARRRRPAARTAPAVSRPHGR